MTQPPSRAQLIRQARAQATRPHRLLTLLCVAGVFAATCAPWALVWGSKAHLLWVLPVGTLGALWTTLLMHECAHGAFARPLWLQGCIGWLAGVLGVCPYGSYKRGHQAHHRWAGNPAKDPTPAPQTPPAPNPALNLLLRLECVPLLYLGGVWWPYASYDLRPTAHTRRARAVASWGLSMAATVAYAALLGWLAPWALAAAGACWWLAACVYERVFTIHHHVGLQATPAHKTRYTLTEQMNFARSIPWRHNRWFFHFTLHKAHHFAPSEHHSVLPHLSALIQTHYPAQWSNTNPHWDFAKRHQPFHQLLTPHPHDPHDTSLRTPP